MLTQQSPPEQVEVERSPTLGDYAYTVIAAQYRSIIAHERKVLADKNPEHLHQMRVGTRRLRTALQVFAPAIALPKGASIQQVGKLATVLGTLRDLDVQLDTLKNTYRPHLNQAERKQVQRLIATLKKQRRCAIAAVKQYFDHKPYTQLKAAYERWLEYPTYGAIAQLPLPQVLPDLLTPLLSKLLLHSAWFVSADHLSDPHLLQLHDLRKVCKHVRYQAEFFTSFYRDDFQTWLQQIKALQSSLGDVQDGQILRDLLVQHLPATVHLPELDRVMQQEQQHALLGWEAIRLQYLDPAFRQQLHRIILEPSPQPLLTL